MLDIKFIRQNTDLVKASLKNRGAKDIDIDELLQLDEEHRRSLLEVQELRHKHNTTNEDIAALLKEKKNAKEIIGKMKMLSQEIAVLDDEVGQISKNMANILSTIPNIPHKSIPVGGSDANKVVKTWGEERKFDFRPKNHMELSELLGIINFGLATKITGRGFSCYMGLGARLERALINFMLDLHTQKHGYKEVFPPFLVNRASMIGTGQLPKLEEDMYKLQDDDLFLIPTAEVPVTNLLRNEVLKEEDLPICYAAYTACFRREAGSYGAKTQGLIRVHQFDKVEMVKFATPETSFDELETLLKDAEEVIQVLRIPYRIVMLATGDISFAAAKCYDIEIFSAGTNAHLEVSSCSNFTDFQARRMNIRYKPRGSKKPAYLHTLNGSGVALARLVVAILENYQNEDGSVTLPKPLVPYMGGVEV
ncbi:MAG: serine--tRNA ligase, partial [Candidatus Omnitrophota bacterium]